LTDQPSRFEADIIKTDDAVPSGALTQSEAREVGKRKAGSSRVVHEVIRLQGDDELDRPAISLALSGLAAGVGITASVFAQAAIAMRLEPAPWAPLIAGFGYSIGFVIVVMGRLQLFTENTITAVLPLINNPNWHNFGRLARLWSIVLVANLVGTFLVAAGIAGGGIVTPELQAEIVRLSGHLVADPPLSVLWHGIPAGFLVAGVAWLLPSARGQELGVIILLTWLISIGGFAHVIASSTEIWTALLLGQIDLATAVMGFLLPALVGNILGGSFLFALLAHGQVTAEL
jgi:formate/nitrite transporter FocA (FNT family)